MRDMLQHCYILPVGVTVKFARFAGLHGARGNGFFRVTDEFFGIAAKHIAQSIALRTGTGLVIKREKAGRILFALLLRNT